MSKLFKYTEDSRLRSMIVADHSVDKFDLDKVLIYECIRTPRYYAPEIRSIEMSVYSGLVSTWPSNIIFAQ